jgi:hypothetical protein
VHTDEEIEILLKSFAELSSYLVGLRKPLATNFAYAREFTTRQFNRRLPRVTEWVKNLGV